MSEYVVIAGLSGAGRSEAAKDVEDLGWFVIDNLPPSLLPKVVELSEAPGSSIDRVALVAGAGQYAELVDAIGDLERSGASVRVLFLQASTPALIRRYEQTRRRHPLAGEASLQSAITRERELLEPVKAIADVVIDTSSLNVHQLRDRVRAIFAQTDEASGMQTLIRSFGFKHGIPLDADLVFDVRFLPNPHWVEHLRPQTGRDEEVRDYVLGADEAGQFLDRLLSLFELLVPLYRKEGKAYLSVAIGCTGGRHRSVAIAEALAERLHELQVDAHVSHRDVDR